MTEARGWPLGDCVTIQSLYHDRRAVWLAGVSRYNQLYRDRSGLGNWLCRYTLLRHGREGTTIWHKRRATRPRARDMTRSAREARARPATRPTTGCNTAHDTAGLEAPCAQPGSFGCAPMHPTHFWTQCTVMSHFLGHCS